MSVAAKGSRGATKYNSKGQMLHLEGIRQLIRAKPPQSHLIQNTLEQLEDIFAQLETHEGKPTILHLIVHSAGSREDFEMLINLITEEKVKRDHMKKTQDADERARSSEKNQDVPMSEVDSRLAMQPLANVIDFVNGLGRTPLQQAIYSLRESKYPNKQPEHCLFLVQRLVTLGADLWKATEGEQPRTALELLIDDDSRYKEGEEYSRELIDYFVHCLEAQFAALTAPAPDLKPAEMQKRQKEKDQKLRELNAIVSRAVKAAARRGYHTPLKLLLPHCKAANLVAEECFVFACEEGRRGCVETLIETHLSKDVYTKGLLEACKHDRRDIVKLLINDADINAYSSVNNWGCLQLASASGHAELVSFLLSKGAKPQPFPNSPHPLHLAARNCHAAVLDLLAAAKIPDAPDTYGRTALHYAAAALCIPPEPGVEFRSADALLLKSINAFDNEGLTPLAFVLQEWNQTDSKTDPDALLRTVKYLIARGADVDLRRPGTPAAKCSVVEIAQERCALLSAEVIVQIWKMSRPRCSECMRGAAANPTKHSIPEAVRTNGDADAQALDASGSDIHDRSDPDVSVKFRKRSQDHTAFSEPKRAHVTSTPSTAPAAAAVRSPLASPIQNSNNLASPLPSLPPAQSPLPTSADANRYATLRYVAVIKDEHGALQWPPHFIVTAHPDGLLDMPLSDVPPSHKHVAITLAVREGKLSDAHKAELYQMWNRANTAS